MVHFLIWMKIQIRFQSFGRKEHFLWITTRFLHKGDIWLQKSHMKPLLWWLYIIIFTVWQTLSHCMEKKIEIIIHKFCFSCIVHCILPLFVPCLSLHSYDNHNQYLLHFTSVDGICSIQGSDFAIHINCFVNSPINTTLIQSMQAIFASSTQCTFHAPYPADSFIKK